VHSRLADADKGRGKWKLISKRLFHNIVLTPLLIQLAVKHINYSVYTNHSMARVMDLHHGFNLCGLENMCLMELSELGAEHLL
jgi:hypothetical protein